MARSRVAIEDELRTLKAAMRIVVDLVDEQELRTETQQGRHRLYQAVEQARPLVNRPKPSET